MAYGVNYIGIVLWVRRVRPRGGDIPKDLELFSADPNNHFVALKYILAGRTRDMILTGLLIVARVMFVIVIVCWILTFFMVGLSWAEAAMYQRRVLRFR